MPPRGRLGFFSQSGALGIALLRQHRPARPRHLDVRLGRQPGRRERQRPPAVLGGRPGTDAVMLYLETIGNPRKFSRVARRLARTQAGGGREVGPDPRRRAARSPGARVDAPAAAVDALFRRRGVIRVDTIHEMFDVGALRRAPAAAGRPTRGDRRQLRRPRRARADACEEAGLEVAGEPRQLGADAERRGLPGGARRGVRRRRASTRSSRCSSRRPRPATRMWPRWSRDGAGSSAKTVVSTFLGMRGVPATLRAPRGPTPARCRPTRRPRTPCALAAVTATPAGGRPRRYAVVPSGSTYGRPGLVAGTAEASTRRLDQAARHCWLLRHRPGRPLVTTQTRAAAEGSAIRWRSRPPRGTWHRS